MRGVSAVRAETRMVPGTCLYHGFSCEDAQIRGEIAPLLYNARIRHSVSRTQIPGGCILFLSQGFNMRTSNYLLSTLKESPAEAVLESHKLMVLYTWLPTGLAVLKKVEDIIRDEMAKAGCVELLMPFVQPADLWKESGRWIHYGPELCRFKDRHNVDFVLGPTHEEVITALARNEIKSYKQLPLNLYHIQTKFRDEIRPRFGVMRAREFIMKDGYSFDLTTEGLQKSYRKMYRAYSNIFTRLGLDFRAVQADTGSIGGSSSHEFQVLADAGEDVVAFASGSDYASNIELTECLEPKTPRAPATKPMCTVPTPGCHTVDEVASLLKVPANTIAKTIVVVGEKKDPEDKGPAPLIAIVLCGNQTLNEVKCEKIEGVKAPLEFATSEQINAFLGCHPGSIGPVKFPGKIIVDRTAAHMADFYCGANHDGEHLSGVNWDRDVPEYTVADVRNIEEGDPSPDGHGTIVLKRGIEVGHIFALHTKYSDAMQCTVLNEEGKPVNMEMGCYGIGVTRVVAAAVEQHHDENGIIMPETIAPFNVTIVPMNMKKSEKVRDFCEKAYKELTAAGIDVLFDDRSERPGVMFADMELIGAPRMLVVGERDLEKDQVEIRYRASGERKSVSASDAVRTIISEVKAALGELNSKAKPQEE